MDIVIPALIALVVGIVLGIVGLTYYQNSQGKNRRVLAEQEAKEITQRATEEAQTALRAAEDKSKRILDESNESAQRRRRELDKEDERLQRRREDLDKRYERMEQREQNLNKRQSRLDKQQIDLAKVQDERAEELQGIAQMTTDEAKAELMQSVKPKPERLVRSSVGGTEPAKAIPGRNFPRERGP